MSFTDLHSALRARDVERSLKAASALEQVPLRFAVRLVALLADEHDRRYDAAARRFLVRVVEEVDPKRAPLIEIKKLADILAHVHHFFWQHEARVGLQEVVGQMHDRDVRLHLVFDSEREGQRTWR